jgi:hypothetical protein
LIAPVAFRAPDDFDGPLATAFKVLLDILAGHRALTHDALDEAHGGQAIEHLRLALVTHHALPARDEQLIRFERWMSDQIAAAPETGRQHLKEWGHWHLLNDLNYRRRRNQLARRSVYHARGQVRHAITFTIWLHEQDLQLQDCQQPHLDEWFAQGNTTSARVTSFLRWAVKQQLIAPVTIPRPQPRSSTSALDQAQRQALIAHLLADDTIDLRDRVAGLLVLLYGQPVTRIARLQLDDIENHPAARPVAPRQRARRDDRTTRRAARRTR